MVLFSGSKFSKYDFSVRQKFYENEFLLNKVEVPEEITKNPIPLSKYGSWRGNLKIVFIIICLN